MAEPIPCTDDYAPLRIASLAHPEQTSAPFPLTSLLTLPPSFGAAYVGESFSCTLCANNERMPSDTLEVHSVSVEAELQTPVLDGAGKPLVIQLKPSTSTKPDQVLAPGRSTQYIVRHDLQDEGPHVLAVTVSYTEVPPASSEGSAQPGPRTRTFRKLYQFTAQQAVGVRTKVGELRWPSSSASGGGARKRRLFAVEAQIENLTEQQVVLDTVSLETDGEDGAGLLKSVSLNLDAEEKTLLAPGDVQQVAFRLEQKEGTELRVEGGRFVLAQMRVDWRMGMGQDGTLRTGWLGCIKRD